MSSRTEGQAGFAGNDGFVSTSTHELTTSRGIVGNNPANPANPAPTPQDCLDAPGDIVVGRVKKSSRESIEVRLRWIAGKRMLLIRLGRENVEGVWRPLSNTCRCGISIRADLVTETFDLLERAEDRMADEGAIP